MSALPGTIEDVTPEWLTAFLSTRRPGVKVERVEIHDKTLGTATRVRLECDFALGCQAGLPRRMFLKSLLVDAAAVGVEVAPASMFKCEVNFFLGMRPELELETPQVYGCEFDANEGRFVVLMEDLLAREARFGVATRPYTLAEARAVLDTVAALHARYWESPRLASEFTWLETHRKGPNADYFRQLGRKLLLQEYTLSPYKTGIFDPARYTPDRLWDAYWRVQEVNELQRPTVLHGDVHVGNTYVLPQGGGGLLDWQLMRIGCWAHDVTYFIVSALEPEERCRHERDLIQHYLAALARRGIRPPDADEAWLLHRQNAIWGALSWLMTPTPLYDRERLTRLLERQRVALEQLDTFRAIA